MSTSQPQSRQPKGIPVGGQFATSARGESGVALMSDAAETDSEGLTAAERADLDAENAALVAAHEDNEARIDAEIAAGRAEEARWGSTGVTEGSRTPWGAADYVTHPAPGITVVGTPGHGGVKVSPERNAAIAAPLRNRSGWYEEDCEAAIVGMYFPEMSPHYRGADVAEEDQNEWRRGAFEASVKDWFPDAYTDATGNGVTREQSYVLRERAEKADTAAFRAEHSDQFVTLGGGDNHSEWIPAGYAACKARLDDTGEERTFLMPRHEVIVDHSYGRHALVDPARHLDVTDVADARPDRPWAWEHRTGPRLTGSAIGIDYSGLTGAQASRAQRELDKPWRFSEGDGTTTVESLGERFARQGVHGKRPLSQDGKTVYMVELGGSRVQTVSKAAYDALTGVPDVSTPEERARIVADRARAAHERAQVAIWDAPDLETGIARRDKAEAKRRETAAAHKVLADKRDADGRAWQEERVALQRAAFARIAEQRGVSFD